MPDPLQLNPERVNKFLQDELNGTAPQPVIDFVNRMRKTQPGLFPPPIFPDTGVGRVNTTGKVQPTQPTEPLPQPPQPTMSMKDKFLAAVPGAIDWAKSTGKAMLDPEALAATAGGLATAAKSTPVAMLASGGAAAATNLGHEVYESLHPAAGQTPINPISPESAARTGEAFVTGALGEGVGRGIAGAITHGVRAPVTPRGQMVENFFGRENTMAHQLADSPPLNFMANVAKYGPTGQHIFREEELKQSQAVLDYLKEISHKYGPDVNLSIDSSTGEFNRGIAGKRVQQDVQGQLKNARATSGFPEFLEQHGGAQETKVITLPDGSQMIEKGPTVESLAKRRSEALKQSRRAYSAGDVSAQSASLKQAEKLRGKLEAALPDDAARNEYRAITDRYKQEMERLDNPAVQSLRKGSSEDVIDNILDNKIKNYAPMKTGTGQTSQDLLSKVQQAVSPEAWQQLQADTVHRLGERATDAASGMVDVTKMHKMLDKLDAGTKQKLFGDGLKGIKKVLAVLEQSQNYKKQEAGRLFIAIRSGQASIALAAGGLGALSGNPKAGTIGAATILVAPYAFAKLISSEMGRTLLTRAATASTSSAKKQATNALTKWVANNVTEAAREEVNTEPQVQSNELSIPEPPQ